MNLFHNTELKEETAACERNEILDYAAQSNGGVSFSADIQDLARQGTGQPYVMPCFLQKVEPDDLQRWLSTQTFLTLIWKIGSGTSTNPI